MKFLSLLATLCLSAAPAFGFTAGSFVGKGIWKMPNGDTGKYETLTVITQRKTDLNVIESLIVHSKDGKTIKKEEMEWTAVSKGKGYFSAVVRGKEAGSGYCLGNQCHVEFTKADSKAEETFTFGHWNTSRLGSETSAKYSVTWQGSMHKARR